MHLDHFYKFIIFIFQGITTVIDFKHYIYKLIIILINIYIL